MSNIYTFYHTLLEVKVLFVLFSVLQVCESYKSKDKPYLYLSALLYIFDKYLIFQIDNKVKLFKDYLVIHLELIKLLLKYLSYFQHFLQQALSCQCLLF